MLGYSLDNLSLMALTLSVGFVVDDAIVMLENIVRHMEMGKPRMQAALDGSKEIGFTILSMTLSLAAVFIPVLFMGGIVGRLLHEFAVTIARGDPGLRLRLADADADAVQPVPEAAALDAPRAALQRDRSACSTRWLQGLRLDAAADDPLQGRDDGRLGAAARRNGLPVQRSCRRASSRARTPASSTAQIEAIQGIGFDAMVAHQRAGHGHPAGPIRTSPRSPSNVGGFGGGRLNVDLKPRKRAHADGGPGHRGTAAEARARAGRARVPVEPAGDPDRRR